MSISTGGIAFKTSKKEFPFFEISKITGDTYVQVDSFNEISFPGHANYFTIEYFENSVWIYGNCFNQTAFDTHEVTIANFPFPFVRTRASQKNSNEFYISPNPAAEESINVNYSTDSDFTDIKVKFLDAYGRTLYQEDKVVEQGEHFDNFVIEQFPEGILYLQLVKNGISTTQSFLKIK